MARSFDASTQLATNSTTLVNFITASAGTFACWYRPLGTAWAHTSVWGLPPILVDKEQYVGLFRGSLNGTDKIYAFNWDGTADVVGFSYTNEVWVHVVWRHTSTELYIYKDGVAQSPVASGSTTSLASLSLSIADNQAGGGKLQGELAEIAIWNVALDGDEIVALAKGFSPAMVRPTSLTAYWPMWGRHSPEIELFEGRDLALVNSPPYAEHPRIIYPTRAKLIPPPTTAPWYYYNLFARGQAA